MAQQISRLRYYDGEYLGAADFTAEQTYHLSMRRELTRYLHLYGIVEGLTLTTDTEAGINSYAVSAGLAIDAGGREILLATPRTLTEADFVPNRITKPGTYQVWIQYSEQQRQVPANGYQLCNDNTQNTRWYETAQVLILSAASAPTQPDQSDLPLTSNIPGLLLGTMIVDNTMHISAVADDDTNRLYIGLRAQQLISPADPGTNFVILNAQTATNPPVSIASAANFFAEQNLITGPDFVVDKTKIKPSPPSGFPKAAGNVKVGGDLFLSNDMFSLSGTDWVGLDERIRRVAATVTPEVHIGNVTVTLPSPPTTDPIFDTVNINISTNLTGSAQLIVGISEVEWLSPKDLATWSAAVQVSNPTANVQLDLEVQPSTQLVGSIQFPVKWVIGPIDIAGKLSPITKLVINYVAVILP